MGCNCKKLIDVRDIKEYQELTEKIDRVKSKHRFLAENKPNLGTASRYSFFKAIYGVDAYGVGSDYLEERFKAVVMPEILRTLVDERARLEAERQGFFK